MPDVFATVDTAISEVTKARQSVMRQKSKQVYAPDEKVRLKSVCYAWFQTHRPVVAELRNDLELSEVDFAYRAVMASTGRNASRSTYAEDLRRVKDSLIIARDFLTSAPAAVKSSDEAPNFAPFAPDPKMKEILERRWIEVQQCIDAGANLAATVMMGGLLESLLLARINRSPNKPMVFKSNSAPIDKKTGKTSNLSEWKLVEMVEVGHDLTWITKSAKDVGHVLREFRNYIHPHKEYTDGIIISSSDTAMFWEVAKAITRQVLDSVGKSP